MSRFRPSRIWKALRRHSRAIRRGRTRAESLSLHLTALSTAGLIVVGIVKVVLGVIALSVFACVNGFYTLAMVGARALVLAGSVSAHRATTAQRCLYSAWGLGLAGVLYMAYSLWAYHHPSTVTLPTKWVGIGIATVTFIEIGVNVRGLLVSRGRRDLPLHVSKAINLSASLVALVLTQAMLLSISQETDPHDPAVSALLGTIVAALTMLIALYEVHKARRALARPVTGELA